MNIHNYIYKMYKYSIVYIDIEYDSRTIVWWHGKGFLAIDDYIGSHIPM